MLTQLEALPPQSYQHIRDPFVVGSNYTSDNAFQEWTVSYLKDIGMYLVKNGGSGRYMSSVLTTGEESYVLGELNRMNRSLGNFGAYLFTSQLLLRPRRG